MIVAALVAVLAQPAACHAINADRIYGRDLAAAVPLFSALSPDIEIGYSPAPGLQRVFHPAELKHIADTYHLQGDVQDPVCFSWPTALPSRESILASMNETLKDRTARVEFIDQSLTPAPKGRLVFPLSGLSGFSAEPVIWRGYVEYGVNHRFAIWARVRVTVKESRVVAGEALASGDSVRANQLHIESYEGPLSRQDLITDLNQAVGMIARFDIPPGTLLTKNMLDKPKEVERGDTVAVIVETASTRIEAEGVAEQAGRLGAVILVRNAKSGRKFRARIDDKDKVSVVPGGPFGLVTEETKS